MQHELMYWKKAAFVTLTYDDAHLPANGSLCKDDLQKFFKRLRRRLDVERGKSFRIKYFACGEYGPKTHRPHYHAIIFGLDYADKNDARLIMDSWSMCSPHMWLPRRQHGRIRRAIAAVVPASIRYVAGYVFKKAVDNSVDLWLKYCHDRYHVDLEPVYQVQSQGIGRRFALDNAAYITKFAKVPGQRPVPRYYRKLLGIRDWTNAAFRRVVDEQKVFLQTYMRDDKINRKHWISRSDAVVSHFNRHAPAGSVLKHRLNMVSSAFGESDYVCDPKVSEFLRVAETAPVWLSNIDFDENRLHAYSRRF